MAIVSAKFFVVFLTLTASKHTNCQVGNVYDFQVGNATTLRSIHYPPIPDSLAARCFEIIVMNKVDYDDDYNDDYDEGQSSHNRLTSCQVF